MNKRRLKKAIVKVVRFEYPTQRERDAIERRTHRPWWHVQIVAEEARTRFRPTTEQANRLVHRMYRTSYLDSTIEGVVRRWNY